MNPVAYDSPLPPEPVRRRTWHGSVTLTAAEAEEVARAYELLARMWLEQHTKR